LFRPPICVIWNSSSGVCSVMVLWLVFCGAMTKPRASLCRPTHGSAARHVLVSRLLVIAHYGTTSMWAFLWDVPWLSSHIVS
jgi:hypothetical protein